MPRNKLPHENACFDAMIGIIGWIDGFIIGLMILCSDYNDDDDDGDLINEIEIFVKEAEHGYSFGKKIK